MVVMLVIEIVFGFLSGFKSAVAMPFVIVGLGRYLRIGSVPMNWVVFAVIGLVIAYAVIEPFRDARISQGAKIDTTVTGIATTMINAASNDSSRNNSSVPFYLNISSRSNLAYIGSLGIDFADAHANLPTGSPKFLENILLAPLHAWIPRAIWKSKPPGNLGFWYTRVVIGNHYSFTSTAMGPITYLYFAGGALAVFGLFFLLGILQRCSIFLLCPWHSVASGVVFISTLSLLVLVDSAVNSIVVNLFRDVPIILVVAHLLFRRQPRLGSSHISIRSIPAPVN